MTLKKKKTHLGIHRINTLFLLLMRVGALTSHTQGLASDLLISPSSSPRQELRIL